MLYPTELRAPKIRLQVEQAWFGRGERIWSPGPGCAPAIPTGQLAAGLSWPFPPYSVGAHRLQALSTGHRIFALWSGREDLNLRHPAPKAGALPGCATPRHIPYRKLNYNR